MPREKDMVYATLRSRHGLCCLGGQILRRAGAAHGDIDQTRELDFQARAQDNDMIVISKSMALTLSFTVVLVCLFPGASRSASFDCVGRLSWVETLICQTPELSQLDDKLASRYRAIIEARPLERSKVQGEQRQWVMFRNQCSSDDCIKDAYNARIEQLWGYCHPRLPGCKTSGPVCQDEIC